MTDLLAPQFQDADKAREYLEALRWPDGQVCPHCGVIGNHYKLKGKTTRPGLWKCKDCRKQFTMIVGTVFSDSKVPLNKWLLVAHLMCASKNAVSAHQIHRMVGVTYKTAWFMCHRVREAMKSAGGLLGSGGGIVEADETYWGTSKAKPRNARGYEHKMEVVSLVERDGVKRSMVVSAVTGRTLRAVLEANVCKSANLMTDEHSGYTKLGREYASHGVTRHSRGEYAIGTYHHVGEQHLQRYVTEFDFRWNHRKETDRERSDSLLMQLAGKRLTYTS